MTRLFFKSIVVVATGAFITSCASTSGPNGGLISTPVENIDAIPIKAAELTTEEKKNWGHLDLLTDTIPGMSVDKAYADIIKNKKGTKVIVAVLDAGIDLNHEDLKNVLWTNKKEIPGNNIDDDKNGFVDDIHGYNFLGESYNEQLEYVRMIRLSIGDDATLSKIKAKQEKEYSSALQNKQQYEQILQPIKEADAAVKEYLKKETYTEAELAAIETTDETLQQHVAILNQMLLFGQPIAAVIEDIEGYLTYLTDQLNYNLNKDFNGRIPVGDNPYDLTDTRYGNGNPQNRVATESHGTHVAGIIAAERNNGKGANGIANNVAIMSIRAVPNGDEYDKDIARGIRYAVDNGARIINGSFGKSFSPNAAWVYDAITYAAEKNVLFVHAAGNDGANLDDPNNPNFPNDQVNNGAEFANNVITVGALNPTYGSTLLAEYSNYGKINVDIFAPGTDIYSSYPNNTYEYSPGTSMAAPGVAGIAAVIMSQYPSLTAAQVKTIILRSGLPVKTKVMIGQDNVASAYLKDISTSGKIANLYNALIMAGKVASGKLTL